MGGGGRCRVHGGVREDRVRSVVRCWVMRRLRWTSVAWPPVHAWMVRNRSGKTLTDRGKRCAHGMRVFLQHTHCTPEALKDCAGGALTLSLIH